MTQVKDIDISATPPQNEDWVLIEKVDEKFVADGSVSAIDGPAYYQPEPFDTLDEAVTAAAGLGRKERRSICLCAG
ncbi:hypothetical protein N8E89_28795 (plasmid) [Phyllobacterium sp. A18/5-2]|uniref:hypothetical protein n=1 Tax=Phyllobacterium sp. A18/5-2 TaxID=2978392 RepID=UPI0021C574CF|nr:hypothetical protein [Phyllobacterium sp. A18/5-2]UXN67497.1 hypothetical protein N8E89_28795 [Phyllobacterium sp. A18/5-2]